jgi:hypothetical protein
LKFADTRAVDIHKLGPATFNAIEEIVGMDYDRSALVLEVTRIVRSVSHKMTQDVSKSGKAVVCDRYSRCFAPCSVGPDAQLPTRFPFEAIRSR